MSTWQEIAATDRDAYSPISEELLGKYYDRDECNRERHIPLPNITGNIGGATSGWQTVRTFPTYVPAGASRLQLKVQADYDQDPGTPSTVHKIRFTTAGGTTSDEQTLQLANADFTLTAAVAGGDKGAEVGVQLQFDVDDPGGNPALYDATLRQTYWMRLVQ